MNGRFKWLGALTCAACVCMARGDVLELRSGDTVEGDIVDASPGRVRVRQTVGEGQVVAAFPISRVTGISWDDPLTNRVKTAGVEALWASYGELLAVPGSGAGELARLRGSQLLASGRPTQALESVTRWALADPTPGTGPRYAALRVRCLVAMGRLDEAHTAARELERTDPDSGAGGAVQLAMGAVARARTNGWEAVDHFLHPRVFAPGSPEAPEGMAEAARTLVELGRTNEARIVQADLLRDYSDSPEAAVARRQLPAPGPTGAHAVTAGGLR
jgi:hypothetical protein